MSNHPYEFEPGMRVYLGTSPGYVVEVHDTVRVCFAGHVGWIETRSLTVDLDHAGTRGLLLDQYRKASGHEHAQPARGADGRWRMCPRPFAGDAPTGEGECEGTCILDAMKRSRAWPPSTEPVTEPQAPIVAYFDHDGRRHRVVVQSGPEPHVAIEWLAAPDALGNERWNSVDTDVEAVLRAVHGTLVEHGVIGPEASLGCVSLAVRRMLLPAHDDAIADMRDRLARIEHVFAAMAHGPLDVLTGDDLDAFGEWLGTRRTSTAGMPETDAVYRERLRFRGRKPPTRLDGLVEHLDARLRRIERRLP